LGNAGMQRRLYDPSSYDTFKPLAIWNFRISQVAYLLALAQLLFIYNFFASLLRGPKTIENPWQVGTLEWTCTASPPIAHNFHDIPRVRHGPHEFNHPSLANADKDWLGQTEALPGEADPGNNGDDA
ncbi:MAG TPA: cytochrome-c oxidase, partial [Polyangia bacterium]|nr:cytochrome-c oxidase [Polyangia bacterium]